jgi:hypothetical protein
VTVVMTRSAIAVVAAILVGGCSGGDEQGQPFTASDAARLADVRPVAPGWTWPENPEKPLPSDSAFDTTDTDPLSLALQKQTADLDDVAGAGNRWKDSNKLANLGVSVYGSPSDAHKALAPFNVFSRGWGKRYGTIIRDAKIDDLGDEAWVLWVVAQGLEVTYHWRRGNLVFEAHVDCFGETCPRKHRDVDAAARAWVNAIDAEARAQP